MSSPRAQTPAQILESDRIELITILREEENPAVKYDDVLSLVCRYAELAVTLNADEENHAEAVQLAKRGRNLSYMLGTMYFQNLPNEQTDEQSKEKTPADIIRLQNDFNTVIHSTDVEYTDGYESEVDSEADTDVEDTFTAAPSNREALRVCTRAPQQMFQPRQANTDPVTPPMPHTTRRLGRNSE